MDWAGQVLARFSDAVGKRLQQGTPPSKADLAGLLVAVQSNDGARAPCREPRSPNST